MANKNVAITDCSFFGSSRNVGFHTHSGGEFIYILSGNCTVETQQGRFSGTAGSMIFVPAGMSHNQLNHTYVEDIFCIFTANDPVWRNRCGIIGLPDDNTYREMFTALNRVYKENDLLTAEMLLSAILARISFRENSLSGPLPYPVIVMDTIAFLEAEYGDPELDLQKIALHMHISISTLKQLFHRHLHCGPASVLREIRLKRAEQLLCTPYLQVQEIAAGCGFRDPDYFSRLFRKHRDISPLTFRKLNCK